ncbi:ferritin family protein [candidate division KSB1 bacterium]|nr:ferritin family protein [candidate division KSB1 bacterium]
MANSNIGIFQAIDMAMEAEKKARQFYLDAVNVVANERGKNLLKQLADFEQNHYDKLDELKQSLQTDNKFVEYKGTEFQPVTSEMKAEISGKIEPNKDDALNVLTLAIQAEDKASEHYQRMAEMTDDELGKDMFLRLSKEENLHSRILNDEFYQLSNQGGVWSWGD